MRVEFALPADDEPVASLVVVVYGRYDLTRATLRSLADTIDVPAEVLVVDNASPDNAGRRLRDEIEGARFVLLDENLGFGVGMNLGALHARGRYLGILNSDLQFEPGWLGPLVDALDGDPQIGAAVPMYLEPTGEVLDAGRLLGGDGQGYGYGGGAPASEPHLSFSRRVDFGAAAALLVRRDAFHRVGGFDPAYGLGYYEDTDLGFTLRAAGFDTIYVPRSKVRHLHGSSFGRTLRDRQVRRNLPIFMERFGWVLQPRPRISRPPYDPHRELVLRDWWADDRLLVLDQGHALVGFAEAAKRAFPRALVTWVSTVAAPPGAADDVEWIGAVPRLDRWLDERRYHYGAVVHQDEPGEGVAAAVARSQPQSAQGAFGSAATDLDVEIPPRYDIEVVLRRLGFRAPAARGRGDRGGA